MGSTSGNEPTWKDPLPSETTQAQQPADSQLDYSDAKRGLEPPAERHAREQPDNPARQTPQPSTCRLSAKTRQLRRKIVSGS
jgi:hypothetical protein